MSRTVEKEKVLASVRGDTTVGSRSLSSSNSSICGASVPIRLLVGAVGSAQLTAINSAIVFHFKSLVQSAVDSKERPMFL